MSLKDVQPEAGETPVQKLPDDPKLKIPKKNYTKSLSYSTAKYQRYLHLNKRIDEITSRLEAFVRIRNGLHMELKDTPEFIAMQRLATEHKPIPPLTEEEMKAANKAA